MPVIDEGFDFVKAGVPLRFVVGQTVVIETQITNDLGVATDITGRSYEMVIGPEDGTPIMTIVGLITNAVNGLVTFTSGSTSALTPGQYVWEVWENTDNYLWGGPVEIVKRKIS